MTHLPTSPPTYFELLRPLDIYFVKSNVYYKYNISVYNHLYNRHIFVIYISFILYIVILKIYIVFYFYKSINIFL